MHYKLLDSLVMGLMASNHSIRTIAVVFMSEMLGSMKQNLMMAINKTQLELAVRKAMEDLSASKYHHEKELMNGFLNVLNLLIREKTDQKVIILLEHIKKMTEESIQDLNLSDQKIRSAQDIKTSNEEQQIIAFIMQQYMMMMQNKMVGHLEKIDNTLEYKIRELTDIVSEIDVWQQTMASYISDMHNSEQLFAELVEDSSKTIVEIENNSDIPKPTKAALLDTLGKVKDVSEAMRDNNKEIQEELNETNRTLRAFSAGLLSTIRIINNLKVGYKKDMTKLSQGEELFTELSLKEQKSILESMGKNYNETESELKKLSKKAVKYADKSKEYSMKAERLHDVMLNIKNIKTEYEALTQEIKEISKPYLKGGIDITAEDEKALKEMVNKLKKLSDDYKKCANDIKHINSPTWTAENEKVTLNNTEHEKIDSKLDNSKTKTQNNATQNHARQMTNQHDATPTKKLYELAEKSNEKEQPDVDPKTRTQTPRKN